MQCLSFVQLGTSSINLEGSRNSKKTTSQYLRRNDSTPYNISPYIMPYDATLTTITASTRFNASWKAQVHSNGVPLTGAELDITATDKGLVDALNVQVSQNQPIEIYLDGTDVPFPSVNLVFQKNI